MTTADVVELWHARLPRGTVRLLETIAEDVDRVWTRDDLGDTISLNASNGTFGAAIGMLRDLIS